VTRNASERSVPNFDDWEKWVASPRVIGWLSDNTRYETKAMYMMSVRKSEDRDKVAEHGKLGEEGEKAFFRDSKEVDFRKKWAASFKEETLRELFEQYYVEGSYDCFCLAVTIEIKEGVPLYGVILPEYLIEPLPQSVGKDEANSHVDNYFKYWIQSMRSECGNKCMSGAKFVALIRRIRRIAGVYQMEKTIRYDECKKLNEFAKELPKERDITSDFLQSIFSSLVEDLLRNKVTSRCQLCNAFILYRKGKKYCSYIGEGKNCGKSARNKRQYERRKLKKLLLNSDRPTGKGSHPAEKRV